MAASISDVATRAGVSVATVSRALRGLPNVAPTTRTRVVQAAQELDYVADPHASRLAAGRTQTIGMVVPLLHQWFFAQVVAGAEGVLAAAGYDVLLYHVSGAGGRERFFSQLPFRKRVDGLIVVDVPMSDGEEDVLAQPGTAVVLVGSASTRFASVTVDNLAGGTAATRHLVNLGHRRIGIIVGLPDASTIPARRLAGARPHPLRFTAPVQRREGYRRVLAEHRLPTRPELEAPGNFTPGGGADAMAQLLATEQPPTAVFAESDEMAIGALHTIGDAGLRVPHDISVVGFDDHDLAEFTGLSTIAQPVVAQGEVAATLLFETMQRAGGHAPHVVLPTQLRVRRTTAPCRRSG